MKHSVVEADAAAAAVIQCYRLVAYWDVAVVGGVIVQEYLMGVWMTEVQKDGMMWTGGIWNIFPKRGSHSGRNLM